jgi:putative spermidine/putrescine transport system substrate-binding protein
VTKNNKFSRRTFLGMTALAGAGAAMGIMNPSRTSFAQNGTPAATAAATAGPLPPPPAFGPIDLKTAGGMDALIAAAKKEAALSTIALPNDWANYGEIKKHFFAKYNFLTLTDLNPDGSSAQEIEAIKANAGNTGPQNPDVIDVGFIWGDSAKSDKILQPYKVATWDTMPDSIKDADGYWYGDYFGTMVLEVNSDVVKNVPQDFADLLKPEYKGQIAMSGDPTGANQAIYAVWAAALANGGSLDDPTPGLNFFKQLAQSGNLVGAIAKPATIAKGETPITLRWDYNALSNRDANKDSVTITVVYPKSGTIAGVYIQAISAYAPRPNAARLWMEYLYSDEGQLLWLKGYAKPARFDDLQKRSAIPDDLLKALPKSDVKVAFPTVAQITAAIAKIKTGWPTVVGVAVS